MVQDIRNSPGYTKNPLERSEGAAPSTTLPSQGAAPSEEFTQQQAVEHGVVDTSNPETPGVPQTDLGDVVDAIATAGKELLEPEVDPAAELVLDPEVDDVSDPAVDYSPLRQVVDKNFRGGASGLQGLLVARLDPRQSTTTVPGATGATEGILSLVNRNPRPQPSESPREFVRYTNQSATRSLPISDRLRSSMSFLSDMGITMEVYSGGQEATGSKRVGSTRHDHGDAADVFFYKGDRRLDWGKPNDRPLIQEIVRKARANGITGIGAGPGYMQQGAMHIGFGPEAVWGAGGKASNAPQWLVDAFNG